MNRAVYVNRRTVVSLSRKVQGRREWKEAEEEEEEEEKKKDDYLLLIKST